MEKLIYKNVTLDEEFIRKLNTSLSQIYAFEYNKYLNDTNSKPSLMELIFNLDRITPDLKLEQDILQKEMPFNMQVELTKQFFSHFGLGEKVSKILDKKDPNYKVELNNDLNESNVCHADLNTFLEFNVSTNPTVKSCATIVHELGHALSSHHLKMIKKTQKLEKTKEKYGENSAQYLSQKAQLSEFFKQNSMNFSNNSICEVESHILEKLFVYDLFAKGIISKKDLDEYITGNTISLKRNLELIIQENDILFQANHPFTIEDINALYLKSKKSGKTDILARRLFIMQNCAFTKKHSERNIHSKHRFRYVVGEIVSSVWLENYLKSDKKQRLEMRNTLSEYLTRTDSLTLDKCTQLLLGPNTSFESAVSSYIKSSSKIIAE